MAQGVDHLVQDEGPIRVLAHDTAFFVADTRLLDEAVDVVHRGRDPQRLLRGPAGIGIADQDLTRRKPRRALADTLDIDQRLAA